MAGFYSIARGESMDGKGFRNRAKAVLVRAIVSGQKIFRRYYYLLDLIFLKQSDHSFKTCYRLMMSLYTLVCPPLFLDWIKFYKADKSRSVRFFI